MTPSIIVHAKVLRPHQWVKNTLVFLPLLAAHKFDAQTLRLSVLAFVSFSLVASSAYVVNDLLDLAADRAHPRKSGRPFASGNIPVSRGGWMAAGLLLSGIATSAVVGRGFILVMIVKHRRWQR